MPDNGIVESVALARLAEASIPHRRIDLGGGLSVIAAARGARVFGPFVDGGASLNWMPAEFLDPDAFAALCASDAWNLGGDRLWLGPEVQYIIEDRADYWGTFVVPHAMDPGDYSAEETATGIRFSTSAELVARNTQDGVLSLRWSASVRPKPEPLRALRTAATLLSGVRSGGYGVTVELDSASPGLLVESWYLEQVNTPGRVLVPATPSAEVTDYYEPAGRLLEHVAGGVEATLAGQARYKVGFAAPNVFGRMGYRRTLPEGEDLLIVRHVTQDPSAEYPEEPDFAPGLRGDSLHIYSDPGGLGGFGELEARGTTIGARDSHGADEFSTWVYVGDAVSLDRISMILLGMT
ncbi:hypothetical protein [Microbacterium sp.]|uniref:hypothetical protein n=1 Tax=Microbacterium sp. TaxID=51671 RepID=UPI003C777324